MVLAILALLGLVDIAYSLTVPRIIQGGMGIRISNWKLAREVARKGELGVISGTAMDVAMVRELQNGDPDGAFRRALATFPDQDMANRFLDKFFIEGGHEEGKPYRGIPMWTMKPPQVLLEATVLANYCEVWLAKHDDDGRPISSGGKEDAIVGINCLTKIQLPNVPSLYGAMLAEVDYVIMGAGIPMEFPAILDDLSEGTTVEYAIDTDYAEKDQQQFLTFSPTEFWEAAGKPELAKVTRKRPAFVPIVSSVLLAQAMLKRARGKGPTKGINGFVIELPTAGGHNAPPRGFKYDAVAKSHTVDLNEKGEPVYGPKDEVDLLKFLKASKGLPFWLAGSYAKPDKFCEVVEIGGTGVQVGSLFALCDESGMEAGIKQMVLKTIADGGVTVFTDPVASPTGFPFKVVELKDTLNNPEKYAARPRVCNLGYLRTPYMKPDGNVGYRCASEPVNDWLKKGGEVEATVGRKCLCNALMADAGFPQVSPFKKEGESERYIEEGLITAGDDVNSCLRFMKQDADGEWGYSARDVVDYLASEFKTAAEMEECPTELVEEPVAVGSSDLA